MAGFLRASWVLYATQLSATLRSKRLLLCGLLAALPVGVALFIARFAPAAAEVPTPLVAWALVAQVVCPLIALVFGSAVVSEEVSERTITYLFTRPVPRAAVLFGRYAAALTAVSALLAASALGVLASLAWRFPEAGSAAELAPPLLLALLLGSAVYAAGFAALGAVVKRPMIVGLAYVFALEELLVNLPVPGTLQHVCVQFQMRSIVAASGELWAGVEMFRMNELVPGPDAVLNLAVSLAACLALGALAVSRKQYELTA